MALEMKTNCEGCGTALPPEAPASICSFECTWCPSCASTNDQNCPNCGGELTARPKRIDQ